MVDETEQKQIPQSPGKPLPPKRSNSRRSVIIVLLGLILAEAVAGGVTWQMLSLGIHKIYLRFAPPVPTSAPVVHNINYPTFGFDPQHSHFNPSENLLNLVNVPHLVLFWTSSTGSVIVSSPAEVNGIVYAGSGDGRLYAFNAQTGAILWTASTGSAINSSPAVVNEVINGVVKWVVYVGSGDGKLYAFNAQTGAILWTASTGSAIFSSPAVANGVVYVGSNDHMLYAFHFVTNLPIVTSISPTSGSASGGTTVSITGSGFTGATSVSFGSVAATSFSVDSDTQITAVSPASSGTVDVTVTTPSGTSAASTADQFAYT